MSVIEQTNTIAETGGPFYGAGAPTSGTSEVQTLTIGGTPSGGTFRIGFQGAISGPITWSATNATLLANIQAALDALSSVGTNGFVATAGTLTAGIGTVILTAGGNLARLAITSLVTIIDNSLTGTAPTLGVAETTPGVTCTQRGARNGAIYIDTTGKKQYTNTGIATATAWTVTGTQT